MFNLGAPEVVVILVLALLVLGPQRLPDAARQVGSMMGELRKLSSGFQKEMKSAFDSETESAARARGAALTQPAAVDDVEAAPAMIGAMAPLDETMPPLTPAGDDVPSKPAASKRTAPASKVTPIKQAAAKKTAAKKAAPAKKVAPTKQAAAKKAAPTKKAAPAKKAPAKRTAG